MTGATLHGNNGIIGLRPERELRLLFFLKRGGEQFSVDELIHRLSTFEVREWLEKHWNWGLSGDDVTIKYEEGLTEDVEINLPTNDFRNLSN